MSEFTSFAVLGAGRVGNAFISALLAVKPTASILILTRSADKKSSLPAEIANSSQVKLAVVDYASVPAVSAALKEHAVEVVVDTVHEYTAPIHKLLADAAKEAGTVKLFVPGDFGFATENATLPPYSEKSSVHKYLKEIGVPYVIIQTGLFTEFLPWLVHAESGKFYIVGSGDKPFSTTALGDIAGFLAHILTTYPSSKLSFTAYRLEGSRLTLKEAAAKFKLPVELVDAVPVPAEHGMDFQTQLQKLIESGRGSIGWDYTKDADDEGLAGSGNKSWEGHVWKRVEDVHGL